MLSWTGGLPDRNKQQGAGGLDPGGRGRGDSVGKEKDFEKGKQYPRGSR